MTYSIDFRKKVLSIKQQDQLTYSETAQRFGVGQSTVVRWSQNIELKRTRNKPTVKLNWDALAQDVEECPDSYQYERAARFGVSRQGIAYALKQLKLSRKKNLPTSQSGSKGTIGFPSSNSPLSSNESTNSLR
jgi:transposase